MNQNSTYKVVLLGDAGVGKTTFVKRHLTGEFTQKYDPTLGVEVHPFRFKGVIFNIWDCAGQEKFGGLKEGYWIQSDACIVMCDATSVTSFKNVEKWVEEYRNVCLDTPIILCRNKVDIKQTSVSIKQVNSLLATHPTWCHYDISCKSNYNHSKPFDKLLDILE